MKFIITTLLLCLIGIYCYSDEPYIILKKKIIKNYPVDKGDKILINNSNGSVHVNTWEKNEVKVEIEFATYTIDSQEAIVLLTQASIDHHKSYGSKIIVFHTNTEVSSDRGFGDYKDTMFSKISVIYNVTMPADMDISILNTSGNIYLSDLNGSVNVNLTNGELHAKKMTGEHNSIFIQNGLGGTSIEELHSAWLCAYNSNVNIAKAFNLHVTETDTLRIGSVTNLSLFKSMGSVNIDSVNGLNGQIVKIGINIKILTGNVDVKMVKCDTFRVFKIVNYPGQVIQVSAYEGAIFAHLHDVPGYNLFVTSCKNKISGKGIPPNFRLQKTYAGSFQTNSTIHKGNIGVGGYIYFNLNRANLELN